MKKCPYCAESISVNSTKCKYCWETINNNHSSVNEEYYSNHSDFFVKLFKSINWSYVWTVIVNLIELLIIIFIYNSLYDGFEIMVISILIIIYLTIRSIASWTALYKQIENLALLWEFKKIRNLLNEKKDEDYETEEEKIIEAKKRLGKQQIKLYINVGFYFIFYIIAIIHLVWEL